MDDIRPDITATEARNADFIRLLNGIDAIFCAGFEVSYNTFHLMDDDGVTIHLGQSVSCRGESVVEYADVRFSWQELIDNSLTLGELAKQRWATVRAEVERLQREWEAKRAQEEAEKAALGKRKAKEAREARAAALKMAEAQNPALVTFLKDAGVINS